jgi:hypothetical protein
MLALREGVSGTGSPGVVVGTTSTVDVGVERSNLIRPLRR